MWSGQAASLRTCSSELQHSLALHRDGTQEMPRGRPSVKVGLGRTGAWGRGHGKVSAQRPGCWTQRERTVLGEQDRKCPGDPQCVAWGGPATGLGSLLDQEGCPLQQAPSHTTWGASWDMLIVKRRSDESLSHTPGKQRCGLINTWLRRTPQSRAFSKG